MPEPESAALFAHLASVPDLVSSELSRVEVLRTLTRAEAPARVHQRAHRVLERIALVRLHDSILQRAATLGPTALGTRDALHLATALEMTPGPEMLTYDLRLAGASRAAGLRVAAPG
ncbi:MAG TPA: PIN domain-containing protein [Thermoanaerobaculia bacterium]|nr:PIN domain-containing protein [Thermoanaerobaculia bacterium]